MCAKQLNFSFNFVLYFILNAQFRRVIGDVARRLLSRRHRHSDVIDTAQDDIVTSRSRCCCYCY